MWFLQWLQDLFLHPIGTTVPAPPLPPIPPPVIPPVPAPEVLEFDTPQHAWHGARVLCDNAGLTLQEKNIISACIYQESRFKNTAKNLNKNAAGKVTSTDWGICQVNDYYHIGAKGDFPSVDYVLQNPEKVIDWMIKMYKAGLLKQWVSYSSGAYARWLDPNSPMWLLAK